MNHIKKNNNTIMAFCNDVLGNLDGIGLSNLITTGQIKASEAVESAINRARIINPKLNAIVTETYNYALNCSLKPLPGIFSGVPTFIKDNVDIINVPTYCGSRALQTIPAAKKTSPFVRQYNAMGFIMLGKSALPELGLTGTTEPIFTGPVCNPWHSDYSAGGSSGGSAALVAAGVVPIAHGNDGAGSIRIPAACCGLVGLKPTQRRLLNIEANQQMQKLPIEILTRA